MYFGPFFFSSAQTNALGQAVETNVTMSEFTPLSEIFHNLSGRAKDEPVVGGKTVTVERFT